MSSPIFYLLALVAIGAAMGMLTSRNAVHGALFLVLNFAAIAAIYVILNAPFIAMVQITVYAGAIMVLFLFVIMLLGAERLQGIRSGRSWQWLFAGLLAIALVVIFGIFLIQEWTSLAADASTVIDTGPASLGLRLFEAYLLPFELTGVLLLTAMIGVVVLNKTKKRGPNA